MEPPKPNERPETMPRFPVELAESVKRTRFWQFTNEDFNSEDELSALLALMYECNEDEFFLFTPQDTPINRQVSAAMDANVLLVKETRTGYYVHPKYKNNFVRIREQSARWEWQREVLAAGNTLLRHQLVFSSKALREFEMQQLLSLQKEQSMNPLKLEPNFMGIGIDLKKAFAWLKKRFAKDVR